MTRLVVSREQHVDHIVDLLLREFDGEVPPGRVATEVNRAYGDLCETSCVETFIPILALRRARSSLQGTPRVAT